MTNYKQRKSSTKCLTFSLLDTPRNTGDDGRRCLTDRGDAGGGGSLRGNEDDLPTAGELRYQVKSSDEYCCDLSDFDGVLLLPSQLILSSEGWMTTFGELIGVEIAKFWGELFISQCLFVMTSSCELW